MLFINPMKPINPMKVFIPRFHGRYEFLNGHSWLLATFREPAKFNFETFSQFCHSVTKTFIPVCAPHPLDICCSGVADTEEAISFYLQRILKEQIADQFKVAFGFCKEHWRKVCHINSFYIRHCIAPASSDWISVQGETCKNENGRIDLAQTQGSIYLLSLLLSIKRSLKVSQCPWSHCLFVCLHERTDKHANKTNVPVRSGQTGGKCFPKLEPSV